MCGLAGILNFDGAAAGVPLLRRMADSLCHRGPDAEGFLEDTSAAPSVGLAHRRLSIIDLSARAEQPMPNEDGTVQVLLNGEIYNYAALRRDLAERHVFRSAGDTEAIAHLYEERGDAVVDALDGMFALAIWDARRRRLLLARDRFGKKPLYYWHDDRRFVFASEIKALLAAGVPARLQDDALGEYLAHGYVPTPRTAYEGIRRLPPASTMEVDRTGPRSPRRYWSLQFPRAGEARPVSLDAAAERVRELLTTAVRKRLISDVPIGVLLSGGVDSSGVAALMARESSGRIKTFTAGFEGNALFDERPYAEQVARHLGTEHHSAVVSPDAASLVETLLHHHDEPFGDTSALPTYLVAREARRHVTVAINGDGGDETFGGYDRFRAALLADSIPMPLRRLAAAGSRLLPQGATHHGLARRLRRFGTKAVLPLDEAMLAWTGVFDVPGLQALLGQDSVQRDRLLLSYREALAGSEHASVLSRVLSLTSRTYLADDLLPKMDRMTMAHGLEARSPLLDVALAEYAATLPDDLKRRGARGKVVLKHALRDLVPPAILARPKRGFAVPLDDWMRGGLRPMLEDTLLGTPRIASRVRMPEVRRLFAEHLAGTADRGSQLWSLLILELWFRKHRLD